MKSSLTNFKRFSRGKCQKISMGFTSKMDLIPSTLLKTGVITGLMVMPWFMLYELKMDNFSIVTGTLDAQDLKMKDKLGKPWE